MLCLDAESLSVLMIISRLVVLNPALRKFRITRSSRESKAIQISQVCSFVVLKHYAVLLKFKKTRTCHHILIVFTESASVVSSPFYILFKVSHDVFEVSCTRLAIFARNFVV